MAADLKGTGCIANAHGSSDPGTGPCDRCGRPRCNGTSSTSGERCRRNPIPGGSVCKQNHGGAAPQVQAKAAENVIQQQADKLVKAIWPTVDVTPVTDPVVALQRLAGQLQSALDVLGDGLNFAELEKHPVQTAAWLRVVRESRQLLTDMERNGIFSRSVEIGAEKIRLMAVAVGAVFDALGLTDEQRTTGMQVLLEQLRAAAGDDDEPAGEPTVVPGQVTT